MLIRFARIDDGRLAALAPEHWRAKASKMRFERERRQELVVGGLLAEMISEKAGLRCSPSSLDFAVLPTGKPCFPARPDIHFSLSHSDEVVMCVVADRPVGCDVEKVVPLDAELQREVGSIADWVRREALFKCGDPAAAVKPVDAPAGYCAAVAFCDSF